MKRIDCPLNRCEYNYQINKPYFLSIGHWTASILIILLNRNLVKNLDCLCDLLFESRYKKEGDKMYQVKYIMMSSKLTLNKRL